MYVRVYDISCGKANTKKTSPPGVDLVGVMPIWMDHVFMTVLCQHIPMIHNPIFIHDLVGDFNHLEKYESQGYPIYHGK